MPEDTDFIESKRQEIEEWKKLGNLAPLHDVLERMANTLDDLSDNLIAAMSRAVVTNQGGGSSGDAPDSDLPLAGCTKDDDGNYLWDMPEDAKAKKCKRCGHEPIYWVRTRNQKKVALEADCYSHFDRCGKERSDDDVPF